MGKLYFVTIRVWGDWLLVWWDWIWGDWALRFHCCPLWGTRCGRLHDVGGQVLVECLLCLGTLVITALTVPGRPGRWVGRAFWSGGERL